MIQFQNIGLLFVCVLLLIVHAVLGDDTLARGWNDKIKWVTYDEGTSLSSSLNRPMMLVFHKSWCGACKALKPKFAASKDIEELSENFVMVNVMDDEQPSDQKFSPDGGYIPRVLFIDPSGTVLTGIKNEAGNEQYKYYYPEPDQIVKSMRRCLELKKESKVVSDEL